MEKPSIIKNFILNNIYQIVSILSPVVTAPYISRVLATEGVGIYSYTYSVQMLAVMLAALGTSSYGAREMSVARDDREKRSRLFWEIELLSVLTTALCLAVWVAVIFLSRSNRIYYAVWGLNILAVAFDITWLYSGFENFSKIIRKNTAVKLMGIVLVFALVREKNGVLIYILILSLSALIGNISLWMGLGEYVDRPKCELKPLRHLKGTLVYFLPTVAVTIYTVFDKTLLGILTHDNRENGYYEMASKVFNVAKVLAIVTPGTVMSPRLSYLFSKGEKKEAEDKILLTAGYIFAVGFILAAGIAAAAPRFVPWAFGASYSKSIMLLQLMCPLLIIIGISNCIETQIFLPLGYRKKTTCILFLGAGVNLILNLVLIPQYKSVGALISTLIAESVITVLYLIGGREYLSRRRLIETGWKKAAGAAIAGGAVYAVGSAQLGNLITFALQVVAGCFIYVAVLVILRDDTLMRAVLYLRRR